jgi:hypothetical protein
MQRSHARAGKRKATKKATKQTVGKQKQKAKSRVARAAGVKDSHDRNDLWK